MKVPTTNLRLNNPRYIPLRRILTPARHLYHPSLIFTLSRIDFTLRNQLLNPCISHSTTFIYPTYRASRSNIIPCYLQLTLSPRLSFFLSHIHFPPAPSFHDKYPNETPQDPKLITRHSLRVFSYMTKRVEKDLSLAFASTTLLNAPIAARIFLYSYLLGFLARSLTCQPQPNTQDSYNRTYRLRHLNPHRTTPSST